MGRGEVKAFVPCTAMSVESIKYFMVVLKASQISKVVSLCVCNNRMVDVELQLNFCFFENTRSDVRPVQMYE